MIEVVTKSEAMNGGDGLEHGEDGDTPIRHRERRTVLRRVRYIPLSPVEAIIAFDPTPDQPQEVRLSLTPAGTERDQRGSRRVAITEATRVGDTDGPLEVTDGQIVFTPDSAERVTIRVVADGNLDKRGVQAGMSTWHGRLFPYPLLAPWTDDYGKGSSFDVEVPEAVLNNGRQIKVSLAFSLHSAALHGLIDSDRAGYAVDISCPRTFVRTTHVTEERYTLVLDASEYDEELLLTPYVVPGRHRGVPDCGTCSEWRAHRPGASAYPQPGFWP